MKKIIFVNLFLIFALLLTGSAMAEGLELDFEEAQEALSEPLEAYVSEEEDHLLGGDGSAEIIETDSIENEGTAVGKSVMAGEGTTAEFEIVNGVLVKYNGEGGDVVIPDGVTGIGQEAFYRCRGLTSVTIPEGVTSIGNVVSWKGRNGETVYGYRGEVFYECTSLVSVKLPNTITYIGPDSFAECTSLSQITIPDSVTIIGRGLFQNCTSLKTMTIPDSVIKIVSSDLLTGLFSGCSNLESVSITKNISNVENIYDFTGCSSLKSITLPEGVSDINFSGCSSLKSITLPEDVSDINFSGCSSLTSIVIPNSVKQIERESFSDCTSLTSLQLPDTITKIPERAFKGCSKLVDFHLPTLVNSISANAFEGCESLERLDIPYSITVIGDDAFKGCSRLTLYGDSGSYVENYAKAYNIPFKLFSESSQPSNSSQSSTTRYDVSLKKNATKKVSAGDTLQITVPGKKVKSYKTDNADVAKVSKKGLVTTKYGGTAKITVTLSDNKTITLTVKVSDPKAPKKVALAKVKSKTLKVGKKLSLSAVLTPADAKTALTWSSSDKKIATVSKKGVVKGVKPGTVTITVKAANGKKATIKLTVKK